MGTIHQLPRDWYRIERNAADDRADVYIYDLIGLDTTAKDFARELRGISEPNIDLHVNSPGGDVFDGIAVYNAIANHPADVTAYVDGLAASAASFVVMAANRVVMQPHSRMMIHDAHIVMMDMGIFNAATLEERISEELKLVERLNSSSDNIASMYAEKAGGTTEDWRALMRDETWYTDQEAVDVGLADQVGRSNGKDAEREAARFDLAAMYSHVPEKLVALHQEIAAAPSEPALSDEELRKLRALITEKPEPPSGDDGVEHVDDISIDDDDPRVAARHDLEKRLALIKLP